VQEISNILDGKALRERILADLKKRVEALEEKPKLIVFLVGKDPASELYVGNKEKACAQLGMRSEVVKLDEKISENELIGIIKKKGREAHAMLVQLPLPKHISEERVIEAIPPEKDADGLHPLNMGKLLRNEKGIVSCTPKGIMRLLDEHKIELKGKRAIVIGRSNIVGKPIAILLMHRHATVTIAHSRTQNLDELILENDVVVAAVGKIGLVKDVKKGAIVVDVGMNRTEKGFVGDVDFEKVKSKASYITPVPGGVGPMTIAMLMENTIECFEMQKK